MSNAPSSSAPSPSPRARAEAAQRAASDPAVSAFVAASAGSGKTKLLTDRLLRLMLAGADPARIQCLTFTRAGAAEMTMRLQARLSRWVTLDDAALDADLAALPVPATEAVRRTARALFAQVLDLPGGMRIGTIHAFCQSLLRRFPLEAALSPHFRLIEDADADTTMQEAREDVLGRTDLPQHAGALERLAGAARLEQFAATVAALGTDRERLAAALALPQAALGAAQRRVLGCAHADQAALIASAVDWAQQEAVRAAAHEAHQGGSAAVKQKAEGMLGWLGLTQAERMDSWHEWPKLFLRADRQPLSLEKLVNKLLHARAPHLPSVFEAEQARVLAVEEGCRALRLAELSAALVQLAGPVLDAYHARKQDGGLLDYGDLIGRSQGLLVDPGAAWVLYKLDGGLDHLLLDEVQDTAPGQWRIAEALTEEFFAGDGAYRPGGPTARSVFAVGDRKQSIFSFQGAAPDEFDRARTRWRDRVQAAGGAWRDVALDVSFRSTAPVLALVDAVFAAPEAAAGVVEAGQTLAHFADRAGHAGTVELWPLAPQPEKEQPPSWTVPDRNLGLTSAVQRLADQLAAWICAQTDGTVRLDSQDRALTPGDVLVLVRVRNAFAGALVRALKARGVPVAGLDRLMLTDQPAVQDLMALGEALLLPQDDLTLACVLTSPLGGLTDDSLMALSLGRPGRLWGALRARAPERPDWAAAWAFLSALQARVDYTTPHALLVEALGALGGRARLFARLGPEAAEPVDEMLNAALAHAEAHPPSLQGFLHWLRRSAAEVKRQPDSAGDVVRIMTVHGAKGLQAPLVILPDTTGMPKLTAPVLWGDDPVTGVPVPLHAPDKSQGCATTDALREQVQARDIEEYHRLLYVALTRAEDRLLVCGWQSGNTVPETSWYAMVQRGFAALDAQPAPFDAWEGRALRHASPQAVPPIPPRHRPTTAPPQPLPAWAGAAPDWHPAPPPAEPARAMPLAPSRPDGAQLGPVPQATSPLAARDATGSRFRRGRLIHALLQHLPALAPGDRPVAAVRFAARPGNGLDEAGAGTLAREALAILDHPDLAPLFGPDGRAEVPLTGLVAGAVVGGLVDRLAVLPDRVLLADFKTNRDPPAAVDDTPVLYLRQMAAYRAVLRAIFPDRPVLCALIWTQTARVATLPDTLLDAHAPHAAATAVQLEPDRIGPQFS